MTSFSNDALRSLTIDERLEARAAARASILKSAGDQPERAAFARYTSSKYPRWAIVLVTGSMLIVFLAAAAPSLFRLYTAGRDYFLKGINDPLQASISGAATFLLAEFLVIVSTLVMRVYFEGRARYIMIVPILMGVLIALIGNWVIEQPSDLFGWLITLAPPVAVLFMSIIGEKLILEAIEQRRSNEHAYQDAVREWQLASAEPEKSPFWGQFYANALRESLLRKNNRYKAGRDAIPSLSTVDWRALVSREMQADNWFAVSSVAEAANVSVDEVKPIPFGSSAPELDVHVSIPVTAHVNGHGGGKTVPS